jgi:hypothetical protein
MHDEGWLARFALPTLQIAVAAARWIEPYFSPTLNGGSLPGGVVSSAIASIIATMT